MRMRTCDTSVHGQQLATSMAMEAVIERSKRLYTGVVELVRRYEELIVRDPELAGRLESGLRLASYLVPGRLGGSWEMTEAAYCMANLYCLLNDYIVTRKCPSASPLSRVRGGVLFSFPYLVTSSLFCASPFPSPSIPSFKYISDLKPYLTWMLLHSHL